MSDMLHDTAGVGLSAEEVGAFAEKRMPKLRAFISRRVRDPAAAEDVLQETLLEALKSRSKFDGQGKPEAWVFGIAKNRCLLYYRQRLPEIPFAEGQEEATPDPSPDPSQVAQVREFVSRLEIAMRTLSKSDNALLGLAYGEGMLFADIAAKLKIPEGSIKSRLFYIRKRLEDEVNWRNFF